MRIVAALGGNALLQRGEKADSDIQESHVQRAVAALAPLARGHDLVITHGNGGGSRQNRGCRASSRRMVLQVRLRLTP